MTDAPRRDRAPSLWELAGRSPDDVAVVDAGGARSWDELERRTLAVGHGLHAAGLEPGDHLALVASNHAEFLEVLIGAQRAGLVVTPVKATWTAPAIGDLLRDAGSRAVATDVAAARVAAQDLGLVLVDLDDRFEDWLDQHPADPLPADLAGWRMSYTSGTTGRPKGVVRPGDGRRPWLETFAARAAYAEALALPGDGPHLVVSRLCHGAPLTFAMAVLARGATLHLLDRWEPEHALRALGGGVASTCVVPSMLRAWLALPDPVRESVDLTALRTVVHGGEPCPVPLKRRAIDWLGPVLVEYYGFTEGGLTVATCDQWAARPGTVGRPVGEHRAVALDEAGRPLPPGRPGTLHLVVGPERFHYRGAPERTAEAHGPDGSITAGDLGWVDEDGYVYVTGRASDVIVSSGVNVHPAQVEAVLCEVEGVVDACVVGGPDDVRGETPVAFVALATGADRDDVLARIEAAARSLAGEQRPRRVVVRDAIPRDPTGKLLRRALRDELWAGRTAFAGPLAPGGTR